MKLTGWFIAVAVLVGAGIVAFMMVGHTVTGTERSALAMNATVQQVSAQWEDLINHQGTPPDEGLAYVAVDRSGRAVASTDPEPFTTDIWTARSQGQTVIEVMGANGELVGYVIFADSPETAVQAAALRQAVIASAILIVIGVGFVVVIIRLDRQVLKPFRDLHSFATRVAGGDLDLPLPMDRGQAFGAFSESFDLMRAELDTARRGQARAEEARKELVSGLAHDIKTPVASIKAAAELAAVRSEDPAVSRAFDEIGMKADQIDQLVTDLFDSTLSDLERLPVEPTEIPSSQVAQLIAAADYRNTVHLSEIPEALVWADPLRLGQVFANLVSNAAKYAGTTVDITAVISHSWLRVTVADRGPGVAGVDLPKLTKKFFRGATDQPGAGLGLYLSDLYMSEMGGRLELANRPGGGFLARCWLKLV